MGERTKACILILASYKHTILPGKRGIRFLMKTKLLMGFSGGIVVKNPPVNAGDTRDTCSIPGLGRCPGLGNGDTV